MTKGSPNAGIFFRNQAVEIAKKGHTVSLILIEMVSIKSLLREPLMQIEKNRDEGVCVFKVKANSLGTGRIGLHNTWMKHIIKWGIKKITEELGPIDVVHAHSFLPAGYFFCCLKKWINRPIVVTEHLSTIGNNRLTKKEHKQLIKTVRDSDAFICVSESLAEIVKKQTSIEREYIVIPNMVSAEFNYNKSKKRESVVSFLAIGGLTEIKQYDFLIENFIKTFDSDEKVQLKICGDGPDRNKLEKIIALNCRNHQIKLLGEQNHRMIPLIMEEADAFVHTSRSETFGVAIIEALTCGLPTIGTMCGGPNEVLEQYGCLPIPVGDGEELQKALRHMYNNHKSFDKKKISDIALEKYSGSVVTEKIEAVYINELKKYY